MGKPNWVKGRSGNPKGRPVDPAKQEVLDIFKKAAPELLELAIKRVKGYTEKVGKETIVYPGDNQLLSVLIRKALPENIKIEGDLILKTYSVKDLKEALEE